MNLTVNQMLALQEWSEKRRPAKTMTTIHNEIIEVKTVQTDDEANALLAKGWILMSTGSRHLGQSGYQAKTYFTLGRKEPTP